MLIRKKMLVLSKKRFNARAGYECKKVVDSNAMM